MSSQSLNFQSLLDICTDIREFQQIHALSIKTGLFHQNPSIPSKITLGCCHSLYSRIPKSFAVAVDYTLSVFDHTVESSSFLYNSLIRAHNQINRPEQAFLLFYQMLHDPSPVPLDKFTFPFVLKSCAQMGVFEEGRQVHCLVLKTPFAFDVFVQNSLIHMYVRCGSVKSAHRVFDGMALKNIVSWNSMIDGLAGFGDIEGARHFFDEMPERNAVSWNSMINGYVRNSLSREALDLFLEFQFSGLRPDEMTLVAVVSAVSDLGLLGLGKRVHGYVNRHEFSLDGILGAALIDMYSKCGSIYSAYRLFEKTPNKGLGHWTTMIVGFGIHGFAQASLQLFSQMQCSGVKPNYITFIGVLVACIHGGLVEEGIRHFILMRKNYDIKPKVQHYGCLVDLLGRSGFLEEAKAVIEGMPMEPGVVIWATLLAACRKHENVRIAEIAAQKLITLAPNYGGLYVLLSDIYAGLGRWEDFSRMRRMMEESRVEKIPGFSWIEVDGEVHEFVVGDKFHPQRKEIYTILDELECKLRSNGYEPPMKSDTFTDTLIIEEDDVSVVMPSILMDWL